MAHELDLSTGAAAMAYREGDETPWHGLGQTVRPDASIEEWAKAARLDWTIQRARVSFEAGGKVIESPASFGREVLYRSDTLAPLSVVSDRYQVVQPTDMLEFFRDLIEAAGFRINTCGALRGGRKVWALADTGEAAAIKGKDLVRGRVLIATSCDQSMPTTAKHVAERVVCANTLAIAMGESGTSVTFPHRSKFDAAAIKAALGLEAIGGGFESYIAAAKEMAKLKMGAEASLRFLRSLYFAPPAPDSGETFDQTAPLEAVAELPNVAAIMDLHSGAAIGSDLQGARGTLWGLVNAVTEFYDHHAKSRTADARIDSAWFGQGDIHKRHAWEDAVSMVS